MAITNSAPTTRNEKPFDLQERTRPFDRQEQIRGRAYELYEQRGKEDGHDLEDWLQAESEVVQPKTKAATV